MRILQKLVDLWLSFVIVFAERVAIPSQVEEGVTSIVEILCFSFIPSGGVVLCMLGRCSENQCEDCFSWMWGFYISWLEFYILIALGTLRRGNLGIWWGRWTRRIIRPYTVFRQIAEEKTVWGNHELTCEVRSEVCVSSFLHKIVSAKASFSF